MMDREEIKKIIPHRDPMLLVDSVEEITEDSITASFYADPGREIFKGHFPGDPVFPGAYTIEVFAQTCDIMVMSRKEYAGLTPLFMGADRLRFIRRIDPWDTLSIRARIESVRQEGGIVKCSGEVYVKNAEAFRGEITLAMR